MGEGGLRPTGGAELRRRLGRHPCLAGQPRPLPVLRRPGRTARRWPPSATCRRWPSRCSAASTRARWTSPIPCGRRPARRLAGMGVDIDAAQGWLARYGTDWVVPGDGDGRRLAVLEEQGIHAEVTLPGPILAGGLSPAMYLGAADGQRARGGVAGAARLRALARRLLRRRPGSTGRLHADRLPRHGPRRGGGGLGAGQRDLRRRHAPGHVGDLAAAGVRRRLLRARSGARARSTRWWSTCTPVRRGRRTDTKFLYDAEHGGMLGLYEVFVFTRRPLWFMIFGGVFDRHPRPQGGRHGERGAVAAVARPGHGVVLRHARRRTRSAAISRCGPATTSRSTSIWAAR